MKVLLRICSALRRAKLGDVKMTAGGCGLIPYRYQRNYHAFTFHMLGFLALHVIPSIRRWPS